MPLSIVVTSQTDAHSPRQAGQYNIKGGSGPFGVYNRFCLTALDMRLLGKSWSGWESAMEETYDEDFYSFNVDDNVLENVALHLNFYEPHLRVRRDYNVNGTWRIRIYLLDFKDDTRTVDIYLGDTKIAEGVNKDSAFSDVNPIYDHTYDAWKPLAAARYGVRHAIMEARWFFKSIGENAKYTALTNFASGLGYTKDVYDPMWNQTHSDLYFHWTKDCWKDADFGVDHESDAHPWGLDPYRYCYESKLNFANRIWSWIFGEVLGGPYIAQSSPMVLAALFQGPGFYMSALGELTQGLGDRVVNMGGWTPSMLKNFTMWVWVNVIKYMAYVRVMQALNVLYQKGDPDYEYTDPSAMLVAANWSKVWIPWLLNRRTTPRKVARETEVLWNGHGYTTWQAPGPAKPFSKAPEAGAMYYTAPISVFLTVMGYKYNDGWCRERADRVINQCLCEAQWGVHGSGASCDGKHDNWETDFLGHKIGYKSYLRPNFRGAGIMVWERGRGNSGDTVFANSKGGGGIPEPITPDPWNMPEEDGGILPSNAEASLAYFQALRTYLYYKHSYSYGDDDTTIPGVGA